MHGKNALPGPLTEGNKLGYGQAGKKECTKFIIRLRRLVNRLLREHLGHMGHVSLDLIQD